MPQAPAVTEPSPNTTRQQRKKWLLLGLGILLAAGCAIGLAVGLTRPHKSSSSSNSSSDVESSGSTTHEAQLRDGIPQSALAQQLPCCIPLGGNMQLRYAAVSPSSGVLDFALLGAVPEGAWMAWGPADPRASNRLMGSADCASGGISDTNNSAWAADMFMSGYAPCDTSDPPSGVCPDGVLNSDPKTGATVSKTAAGVQALDNVKLLSGSRVGGITVLRMQRPLAASDVLDHAIDPSAPLNYVWGHGQLSPLDPSSPQPPSVRMQQHGSTRDSYGALKALRLSSCPTSCPELTPLKSAPKPAVAPAPASGTASGTYNNTPKSLALTGGGAEVVWRTQAGAGGVPGVALSFKALEKSQWASLGVGKSMVGAIAYVAWRDQKTAAMRTGVYNLTSYSASGIKALPPPPGAGPTAAPQGGVGFASTGSDGRISFDVWLPAPRGSQQLPLLWALGDNWSQVPGPSAQHFAKSDEPTILTVPPAKSAPPAAQPPSGAKPAAVSSGWVPRPLPGCNLTHGSELKRLGDGWCDAGYPYNTAECAFDGGDCCNSQLAFFDCRDPSSPMYKKSSPRGLRLPAPRNPRYTAGLGRTLSTKELVTTWNNFYEFSTDKDVHAFVSPEAHAAMELGSPGFGGWKVTIDGLVAKPLKMDVRDLINMFHIEERVYRHRCVEAWAIVVPWIGFPLRKLLATVQPLPGARYVRFETDAGKYMPNAQGANLGPGTPNWPYVEGLTLQEAMNDLAFVSIGQFNATLLAQSGAPIRMNVPWKYGFKSVKSIRKISLVADQPVNYWKAYNPDEYGFWANINPRIPHRRWSQAQEQLLVDSSTPSGYAKSLPFNNYTEEVAFLYPDPTTAAAAGDRTYFY